MLKGNTFDKILLLFFCLFLFTNQFSLGICFVTDLSFTEHLISSDLDGALHACTIDLDLDGDIDIVTSASNSDRISFWNNDNLQFTEQIIDNSFDEVLHIHVVDLDLDGDLDILGGAQAGNELAWWENSDMAFSKRLVSNSIIGAHSLHSGDIDQDGDLDLFSTGNNDVSWWENDGSQVFTQHILHYRPVSSTKGFVRYIYAVDSIL